MSNVNHTKRSMALLLSGLASSFVGLVACESESLPAAMQEAEAAQMVMIELPTTKLKGRAPVGSEVSEALGKDLVDGPDLVVTVERSEGGPAAIEAAKKE